MRHDEIQRLNKRPLSVQEQEDEDEELWAYIKAYLCTFVITGCFAAVLYMMFKPVTVPYVENVCKVCHNPDAPR